MLKRIIFLSLAILAGCSNPPEAKETNVRKSAPVKSKAPTAKPAANPWKMGSYAPKNTFA